MNPVIVIPTFVSPRRRKDSGSVIATYDHTTPLSNPGELPRLLTSLQKVRGIGQIIVLVAAEPAISDQAAEKVQDIVSRFPSLNIAIIGADECSLVQQRMEQLGLGKLSKEIGLTGYGAIRNLGLVLANVMGFDSIVFLDDDEVIDDADFLQKGVYGLGKLTRKGVPILAKTGFYLNSEGSYLSKSQDKWYNRFWQQGKAFNKWITKAMRGPRLSRSNHVCGGCLAIHKEAFKRLSFDPWVARGEDLDYLFNMRMFGYDVWFDNEWTVRHLPPESEKRSPRFMQDVYRWYYERAKLTFAAHQKELIPVTAASLMPYPGPWISRELDDRVRKTAMVRSVFTREHEGYLRIWRHGIGEAKAYARQNAASYLRFQSFWPKIMDGLWRDAQLISILEGAE